MKKLLIALSVFGLLAAACGSDDDGNDSSGDKNTATTQSASSGGSALKAKLLTASDLPDGFKRTSTDERPSDPTSDDQEKICPESNSVDNQYPGEREAEADFEKSSDTTGLFVNEQIIRYKDESTAKSAFTGNVAALRKCTTFTETDDDGSTMSGTLQVASFDKIADESFAEKMVAKQTTSDGSVDLAGHLIAIRQDNYIVLLTSLGSGDEITLAQLHDVGEKAVAKL